MILPNGKLTLRYRDIKTNDINVLFKKLHLGIGPKEERLVFRLLELKKLLRKLNDTSAPAKAQVSQCTGAVHHHFRIYSLLNLILDEISFVYISFPVLVQLKFVYIFN